MTYGYLIYQAERPVSHREQAAIDARRGELARGFARLLRPRRRQVAPAVAVTVPDYPPAEWAAADRYA